MTPTKRTAIVAALWIVGCMTVGIVVGLRGEHNSWILLGIIGLLIGLAGTIVHGGLLFSPRFRRTAPIVQGALCFVGTLGLLWLPAQLTGLLRALLASGWRPMMPVLFLTPVVAASFVFTIIMGQILPEEP
jgi:hypothetical protein